MPRVEWRPHECVALKVRSSAATVIALYTSSLRPQHVRAVLALCPNSSEVWVFTGCADRDSTTWTRAWVLREHDMLVSGVDWHAGTNRIVTCSHDRNAFVWSLDAAANVWRPQVVLLRVNRAAMGVRWSPDGARFAVASSNKHAVVCTFEPANNWWVGRAAQKAKSTVTAVSWHPSGVAVASSSTDYRVRVTSVADGGGGGAPSTSIFGPLPAFGTELCEFEETRVRAQAAEARSWDSRRAAESRSWVVVGATCETPLPFSDSQAWINDCAWSPSGRQLAFVGHDGLLHVVAFDAAAAAPPAIQVSGGSAVAWRARSTAARAARARPFPHAPRATLLRIPIQSPLPRSAADGQDSRPAREPRAVADRRVARDRGPQHDGGHVLAQRGQRRVGVHGRARGGRRGAGGER